MPWANMKHLLEALMARITVVDDSRLARTFASACLRKRGHETQEVDPTSIFDVLKTLQADPPDLLIMDFLMPNCPGTSLARVCHDDSSLKAMKTVVLTAHRDDDVTARLKSLGVSEVMFKPFDPERLLDTIEAVLREPPREDD
jgi:CheY-like chemotaxis protein